MITYNESKKDLPVDQLYRLFYLAGWTGPESSPDSDMLKNFNTPFINSTLVISAWDGKRLVGAIRVLSDKAIRSVIYDLVVDPGYQNKGMGKNWWEGALHIFLIPNGWFKQKSILQVSMKKWDLRFIMMLF